jgi:hypothetical protein
VDPPSLQIWPGPQVRVAPEAVPNACVSADGDINSSSVPLAWNSRRHTSLIECAGYPLKDRHDHAGQTSRSGLTEVLLGFALAGRFTSGLRHACLVVGQDAIKLLLDIFSHA